MFIVKNQKETELIVNILSVSTEPLTKEEPCIFAFGGTFGIVLTNIFNNSANQGNDISLCVAAATSTSEFISLFIIGIHNHVGIIASLQCFTLYQHLKIT